MKKLIIALILAIIFIISLLFLPKGNPISAQGGYAYGAEQGVLSQSYTRSSEQSEGKSLQVVRDSVTSPLSANITVRYIIAQPFQSLDELNAFLDYYRAHKRIVFVANGQKLNQISDNCMWMAKDLQDMAAKQGYDFPTETLTQVEMYKIYGKWPKAPHRINKAWIPGVGEWYYDFNTDKLWRAW